MGALCLGHLQSLGKGGEREVKGFLIAQSLGRGESGLQVTDAPPL